MQARIGHCTDRVKRAVREIGGTGEGRPAGPWKCGDFRGLQVSYAPQEGGLVAEQKGIDAAHRRVIFASSLGTVFEWYDFYLYASLVTIITKKFFSGMNDTTAFLFALLAFAAGFFVRPFGALVFGRLGDLVGRK